jgi:hypothetical protein
VTVEVDEKQVPKEILDLALDSVVNGPMTTRYGSIATHALLAKHGEVAYLAARKLVEPLRKELTKLEDQEARLIDAWKAKYGLE